MDDLTPVTRTERLLDGEDLTPTNREEMFIKRIYDKTQEIPEPVNRKEYFLKKAGEAGGDITVESLSVTANGIYSEEGKAYSPVTVSVQPPANSYQLKSMTTPTPLATFEADGLPLNSLKVSVEAKQDLSHGVPSPTNICPISGWDEANVSDVGKNWTPLPTLQGLWMFENGEFSNRSTWCCTEKFSIKPNETYTFSATRETRNAGVVFYEEDGTTYIGYANNTNYGAASLTFTTPSNCKIIAICIADKVNGQGITPSDVTDLQLEIGSTATEYEPYVEPNLYIISLPQTVYGGELDVVNGTSGNVINREKIVFDGSSDENWSYSEGWSKVNTSAFYLPPNSAIKFVSWDDHPFSICNILKPMSRNEIYDEDSIGIGLSGSLDGGSPTIRVPKTITNVNDLRTWLANNNIEAVYELATPTTFTTQPTPIKSLNGINNLSVDCGEIIEGEYFKALGGE